MSIARSPITNRWGQVPIRKRLDVEHITVFRASPGKAYNHQQQVTFNNGVLYASWTQGVQDEEGPNESMVIATSADAGTSWSEPMVVGQPYRGVAAESVCVSSGIRVVGDRLIAYFGEWERTADGLTPQGTRTLSNDPQLLFNSNTWARVSDDAGKTWGERIHIWPRLAGYMTPATTRSGRVILPGHLTFPYTDDPMGLSGWKFAGIPGTDSEYVDLYFNFIEGNARIGGPPPAGAELQKIWWLPNVKAKYYGGSLFNEACPYQTDDGVIHIMLRNDRGGNWDFKDGQHTLGVTESHDDGVTWSPPMLTDYVDSVCRAHFGRLSDGRYFGASCPQQGRTPMVLALSHDGITFDEHYILGDENFGSGQKIAGLHKGGRYGYPYFLAVGDIGYVIYSIHKEDIAIGRFDMNALK